MTRSPFSSLTQVRRLDPRRLLLASGVLVGVVIVGGAAGFIAHLRMAAMERAENEMSNLSAVLAEQTARTLHGVELVLGAIEGGLEALSLSNPANNRAAHELLVEKIAGVPQIKYATVIGADGKLAVSSFSYPTIDVSLGDRSYFIAHRDRADLPLVISEPVQSRTSSEWLIFVSRRLKTTDGSFAGILAAAIDPAYFEDVYRGITLTEGTAISLLRRDGIMLVRYPRLEAAIGRSFADGPVFRNLSSLESGRTIHVVAQLDQQPVLTAPRAVRGYPLVVLPSIRQSVVLANWRQEALLIGGVAVAAALAILVLLIFLRRTLEQVAAADAARQAGEESARHQAEMLATLIENLPVGIALVGPDLRYRTFNSLFLKLFDLRPDMLKVGDLFGKLIRESAERGDYGPGDVEAQVSERVEQLFDPAWRQHERVRPNGQIIDIRRVKLPDGGFVTTYIDVTDRRQLEVQLVQAQKMEAVGQLSGGVAHDFNNLLAVVIGNLDGAIEAAHDRPDVRVPVAKALDAARRGAELVRRLLAFARNQPLQPKLLDLGAVVSAIDPLLRRSLGEHIVVEKRLPEGLWPVMADPAQLDNVILNLAINARDAMPGGGKLTVACANVTLDDIAAKPLDMVAGDYVTLTVRDTGIGIPPDVLPRVFDPFFTTKEVGKGTGLGLSMVYGYARQSGGTVKIYSELALGTDVRLYLPRPAGYAVAIPAPAPQASTLPTGQERILVVEDKEDVREVAVYLIGSLGYQTFEAEDAAAALRIFDRGETFDLLFTDLVMPGTMNGVDLAREARRRFPSLAIVFTSGFSDPENLLSDATALDASIISKPYRKTDLAEHLRAALDRPKTG